MACPVCNNAEFTETNHPTLGTSVVDCPQCGPFTISHTAVAVLSHEVDANRWKISAWINEFLPTVLTSADVELALASAVPSLHHRADRMLRWITTAFPPGSQFRLNDLGNWRSSQKAGSPDLFGNLSFSRLTPIGWNKTFKEMQFMATEVLCNEMGLLCKKENNQYQVSPKGLLYLEGRRESVSSIGFCAMWFSPDVLPLWTNVIEPATRAAGYEPLRIDSKPHNGKIDDEIMASIRASRFVVSDFTGNRGGVYYEAGFAHGLGLPVIFMCREDALKKMHFDIRQYNCILWTPETLEVAKAQLKNRILATLGQGPKLVQ